MQFLKDNILHINNLSSSDLQLLKEEENYLEHPNLALAFYHCCSSHPDAFTFKDESLLDESSNTFNRINKIIEDPLNTNEIDNFQ